MNAVDDQIPEFEIFLDGKIHNLYVKFGPVGGRQCFRIDTVSKTYQHDFSKDIYEYKIQTGPVSILVRLLERRVLFTEKLIVKNGVVLESALLEEKYAVEHFRARELRELKQETEWHELQKFHPLPLTLIYLHPEAIETKDFIRYLEGEKEIINLAKHKVSTLLKSDYTDLEIQSIDNEDHPDFPIQIITCTQKDKKANDRRISEFRSKFLEPGSESYLGITEDTFFHSLKILDTLNHFVGR